MSKGLEALHHLRIKSAKVDISAEGKHDIAYMFFEDTKQYATIEQELKALTMIEENLKYGYVFIGYGKDKKPLFRFADTKLYEEIKKNTVY